MTYSYSLFVLYVYVKVPVSNSLGVSFCSLQPYCTLNAFYYWLQGNLCHMSGQPVLFIRKPPFFSLLAQTQQIHCIWSILSALNYKTNSALYQLFERLFNGFYVVLVFLKLSQYAQFRVSIDLVMQPLCPGQSIVLKNASARCNIYIYTEMISLSSLLLYDWLWLPTQAGQQQKRHL